MPEVIGFDHVHITMRDLARSEAFYDKAMSALGSRKNAFGLRGDPHVQYFNRHFGCVLRPARSPAAHDLYALGLHHLCLRVKSIEDVIEASAPLHAPGIDATPAAHHPGYAPDYWATFFFDPDRLCLEVTNYREERRRRHDEWDNP